MDTWNIAPLYLNYERFIKENTWNFSQKELFGGIKILLLRNNKSPSSAYHLPSIRMLMKSNLKQSITESIEKLLGINFQAILKITELNVYNKDDKIKHRQIAPLELVFLKTDEVNTRTYISNISTEFISILEIAKLNISEQSNEYIYHLMKWIEKECLNRNGLQKWFNTAYNKEIVIVGPEYVAGFLNREIKQKSTSLDTISHKISLSLSTNIESSNKKQADSLDQLSQKFDKRPTPTTADLKIALKSKISKTKSISTLGPITAMRLNESPDENFVIENPLVNNSINYQGESDIVIENAFWNKGKPDLLQDHKRAQSLFSRYNIFRAKCWSVDYPLHFASHEGDILQVVPLIDKGYNCTQKDHVGWTPLHYAVWYGHKDIVSIFLDSNTVSVNSRTTTDLLTPLHMSIYRRHGDIVSMLLKQPEIDLTLATSNGEDARMLADRLKQQSVVTLMKSISQKPTKWPVYLMDNSVRHLVLTKGMDTTFQNLKIQMIEALNIPHNCVDVFNFWIGYKLPKLTGKYSVVPLQCFGELTVTLKEVNVDDMKLHWKRNLFLSLDTERRVKDLTVISLLFEESVHNFTTESLYPCDAKDIVLLCSILLYLYLPEASEKFAKSNRRTLSLSRIQRPLSFMFGSNPDVSSSNLSSSLHTLKDLTLPNAKAPGSKILDKSQIIENRKLQAKQFLSNEKNLAQITPRKKIKNLKINFKEDIFNQFFSSSFSYKSYTVQDIKFRFLTLCWNLTLYGCAYFHVDIKLQPSIPFIGCILAINDMGVYIMHSKTKTLIQNFKYSSISWNNCVETKCLIFVTKKNNIYIKSKFNKMISQLMLSLYAMNPL